MTYSEFWADDSFTVWTPEIKPRTSHFSMVPLPWANLSACRIFWLSQSVKHRDKCSYNVITFCLLCVFPWKNSFHIWRNIFLQNKELKQQRQKFKIKNSCSSDRGKTQSHHCPTDLDPNRQASGAPWRTGHVLYSGTARQICYGA